MIVIFDKGGNAVCMVGEDKLPLVVQNSNDQKRRKFFLRLGEKRGQGLCLNTKPEPEIKKETQYVSQ